MAINPYKSVVKHLTSILFVLLSLNLSSCCANIPEAPNGKPTIFWTNYDFDDGLGNPLADVQMRLSETLNYSIRGLEILPIEGGVECSDLRINSTGQSKSIWAVASGQILIYSDLDDISWNIVENTGDGDPFVGASEIRFDSTGGIWGAGVHEIVYSGDNGTTWETIHPGLPQYETTSFSDVRIIDNTVWVVAHVAGIVVKIDITSREYEETCSTGEHIWTILPASNDKIYIGTASGLFESLDGGYSFSPLTNSVVNHLEEAGGTIWSLGDRELTQLSYEGTVLWSLSDHLAIQVFDMAVYDETVYAVGKDANSEVVLIRIDTGVGPPDLWDTIHLGGVIDHAVIYVEQEDTIYLSLPGIIAVSNDGGDTWAEWPIGISTVNQIKAIEGVAWVGLNGGTAARFIPETSRWETLASKLVGGPYGLIEAVHIASPQEILLAGKGNRVAITTDGGEAFDIYVFDEQNEYEQLELDVWSFDQSESGSIFLAGSKNSIDQQFYAVLYESKDGGMTWSLPEIVREGTLHSLRGIVVTDNSRGLLWSAIGSDGLFKRSIEGGDWMQVLGFSSTAGACRDDFDNIYVVDNGCVNILYSGEDSWVEKVLPSDCQTIQLFVDEDQHYWVAATRGLFYSSDGGDSWASYTKDDGMPSDYVNTVFVEGSGESKTVWVGTALGASRGVVEDVVTNVTSVTTSSIHPD